MSTPASASDRFGTIQVRGARENNLKNVSVDIPRRRITVFTGVSGSGKSSLVFDTIAAESQRLLNETFSTFVQNFLPRYGQPDVDVLANLSTAIVGSQLLWTLPSQNHSPRFLMSHDPSISADLPPPV